ncbi:efflux RND transporter periplasmic adaptor subunit [Flaviaesturariibacter flavus]|uniref:Efflux RND transporter periplasmic adaptor subunit n=1 Tax=Flaviaesturariibacter flavus TaxID=2502780 RepID=A0A4R1B2A2_9BACT|nr:efflux RND transporter periplasmic adaptor subunit [Flaviaesturariibacter flavus]TCJ12174.1 efflux RND transporter periplasmic adaptor subunit [Flaviaesturariibacter flavus]
MKTIYCFTALALLLAGCAEKQAPAAGGLAQTFVLSDTMLKTTTTATATLRPLRNELKFFGKITADNNKFVEVFPVVGGSVTRVFAELGDYVKKGQVLAIIRSTEVAAFEKELQDARKDEQLARNNLRVAQELFDGKINTEREVLEARTALDKARSQLARVQETYRIYHLRSGSTYEVRAPISGFIIQKRINEDMLLRSDRTDNIFDIAEINEVWALANVNESDINQVRIGHDAEVNTLSYPDRVFTGKVDKIFNVIDPETMAMKVRIRLPNPGFLLKPDMRTSIRVSYEEPGQMIAVPAEAIIFDKNRSFVMVYRDRHNIETRPVEVARQVAGTAFLAAGLAEGEKVITHNQLLIYDALND